MQMRTRALLLALALAGCSESFDHDSGRAAQRAEEFARVAMIGGDGERAYGLLSPATKRYVPLEQFKHVLARLHPQARPARVTATGYEPMKGEKAIFIYLLGENSGERFYYRITMEGTAATDYRVLKFERAHEPYTHSSDMGRIGE